MEVHMNKLIVRTGLIGLVTATALALGGCSGGVKEENAALREQNAQLLAASDESKKNFIDSEARRNEAEGKAAQKDAEIARLQQELASRNTTQNWPTPPGGGGGTSKREGSGRSETIVVAGDVLFGPGSATLTSGGKKEIDTVIAKIKSRHQGDTIRVEGYTDSDPIVKAKDKFPTNKALSQARAQAVENYMASKGISASRISAVGMGSESPKATKAASRRVEIVIVDTN
jgi:chemotaxis protein MotB